MPYDSISGAPKAASSSWMTWGGMEDDEDRRNRNGLAAITSWLWVARARMVWCIVGTAVYQVGLASLIQAKNLSALKPGVEKTRLPAASGASKLAISPWMWNSGMTMSPQSSGASWSVEAMFRAEAVMFRWDNGT